MDVNYNKVDELIKWTSEKIRLDKISINARRRHVNRGQVYRCNFGYCIGSEMEKERPAVIISQNAMNSSSGNVIVVPITHDRSVLPCMVPIVTQCDSSGVTILDGQVNTSHIMCLSKARLGSFISSLTNSEMKLVDAAVSRTIDVMRYYNSVSEKLSDKITRIDVIKRERNDAQDKLKELYEILKVDNFEAAKEKCKTHDIDN